MTLALDTLTTTYLGSADVLEIIGLDARVRLESGGEVQARMALAFPYIPAVGDELLVIGHGERHFVIGVLRGQGSASLRIPGDVELAAVGGKLTLSGDEGVNVRGSEVEISTKRLNIFADAVKEKIGTAYRWVKNLCTLRAGKSETIVDTTSYHRALQTTIVAEQTVKLNAQQIHLG